MKKVFKATKDDLTITLPIKAKYSTSPLTKKPNRKRKEKQGNDSSTWIPHVFFHVTHFAALISSFALVFNA